ncbi:hypothetical protein K788_0000857 [Paraburkholderia caribensis MBA4]|uniref:Uncharacterized protein n=1 Tax=Paraburkholderia caribensis MBA4 TaxID=1323664 RepID=A0A0P0RHK1_9BURK|nr:hypothetical protein K788_0000857 [Paraburkholderia caribensis MBA4]
MTPRRKRREWRLVDGGALSVFTLSRYTHRFCSLRCRAPDAACSQCRFRLSSA